MRIQVVASRTPPPRAEELHRLQEAVARRLTQHSASLRKVVVSVEGEQLLRLRGQVLHERGRVEVEHLDPGDLSDATPHFADRLARAVARVLALGLHDVPAAAARRRRGSRR